MAADDYIENSPICGSSDGTGRKLREDFDHLLRTYKDSLSYQSAAKISDCLHLTSRYSVVLDSSYLSSYLSTISHLLPQMLVARSHPEIRESLFRNFEKFRTKAAPTTAEMGAKRQGVGGGQRDSGSA